jgi:hypothetical protein
MMTKLQPSHGVRKTRGKMLGNGFKHCAARRARITRKTGSQPTKDFHHQKGVSS